MITRPDEWLPKLHAGEQGPNLRSLEHLGKSTEANNCKKKIEEMKCDGLTNEQTDRLTDGQTDRQTNKAD